MQVDVSRKHFSVNDYYRMLEIGILSERDHVELVEGEIFEMSPIGSRHAARVDKLNRLFNRKIREQVIIRVQNPIRLNNNSEPEPDIVLVKPCDDFYSENHPTATDVLLIVEVSDSSNQYDREIKIPIYARAGIPEVWLVDVQTNTLEIYKNTVSGEYREYKKFDCTNNDVINPEMLPDISFNSNSLLK